MSGGRASNQACTAGSKNSPSRRSTSISLRIRACGRSGSGPTAATTGESASASRAGAASRVARAQRRCAGTRVPYRSVEQEGPPVLHRAALVVERGVVEAGHVLAPVDDPAAHAVGREVAVAIQDG